MEEKNFTPGPWHWDEEGLGNKNHIVFGKEYPAEMTSKANKAIIAAAPDLFDALSRLKTEIILSDVDMDYIESHFRPWLNNAQAALNKALGKE